MYLCGFVEEATDAECLGGLPGMFQRQVSHARSDAVVRVPRSSATRACDDCGRLRKVIQECDEANCRFWKAWQRSCDSPGTARLFRVR